VGRSVWDTLPQNFARYFAGAIYYEWEDLQPSIVQVAQDASIAWMIVRTKVRRTQAAAVGQVEESTRVS
jgi:hypothetical protein